ncbi:MAG: thiamine pyrophosphate-binding protein [Pseudomonadota bacterium]
MSTSTLAEIETKPAYELLARDLKSMGVQCVFGLMSDDTAVLAVTIDAMGIEFHGARHENNAIAMAEGYAAATGGLGVALVGRGPATANGLHAATYASRTGSSVLIMYGDAPAGDSPNGIGPDYKAFNALGVLHSAGLKTFRATSPADARSALADAIHSAKEGRAVALLLPTDVQLAETPVVDSPIVNAPKPPAPVGAREQSIASAAALLATSKRPLILAGQGAYWADAKQDIETLAERIGALLITTARGKELFAGSPYNLGILGSFSHSMGRRFAEQADCVLAIGASLNFFTMSFGTSIPAVPLIHVDAMRSNIGRWCEADIGVVGDAKRVTEQLLEALPARAAADKPFHSEANLRDIADFAIADDFQPANTARTLDPRTLGVELDRLLPKERNLVYDAGNFLGIVPYLSVPGPQHFKFTSDFASIGLGFGTAMGVAKARPDIPTVLVVGDGGFLMTIGELETVIREDAALVIVVMNDCAYGAELHFLRMWQQPVERSVFPDIDFAPIAQGFAFESATVRTVEDLRALAPILQKPEGPILLDCKLNADVAAPFMSEFAAHERGEH